MAVFPEVYCTAFIFPLLRLPANLPAYLSMSCSIELLIRPTVRKDFHFIPGPLSFSTVYLVTGSDITKTGYPFNFCTSAIRSLSGVEGSVNLTATTFLPLVYTMASKSVFSFSASFLVWFTKLLTLVLTLSLMRPPVIKLLHFKELPLPITTS